MSKKCDKCWREYAETLNTDLGVYRYCGFHIKQLKQWLDEAGKTYY